MAKRFFRNTLFISITSMLILAGILLAVCYSDLGDKIPEDFIIKFALITVGAIILLTIVTYYVARVVAKSIVAPLDKIDLKSGKMPNAEGLEEFKPLLSRIRRQNVLIETNIRDIKREYAKRENFRRDFTANVSHELKTPLTSISGISEMLMNGIIKQEDVPEFAENINKEAARLIALVNDIILISRLEGDEIPQQKESVNIYEIAVSVISRLELLAQKKNVTMELCSDEKVMVEGARDMLEELVFNLCDNAIKYNVNDGHVKVILKDEASSVKIIVEDTGIGIPDEDKQSVFERFYRVDKSRSKEVGGTGLGLSIVKHIAIYHNGKVKAENGEKGGTRMVAEIRK